MNNQYKYSGQPLTPHIAQELIQELFSGQTVQKQEIITGVNQAHLERGGLAPEDPITTALSAMKESGLAENLENDVWSIPSQTTEQIGIKTLNEFIEWSGQFRPGECLFRGVKNKIYKIQLNWSKLQVLLRGGFFRTLMVSRGSVAWRHNTHSSLTMNTESSAINNSKIVTIRHLLPPMTTLLI